MIVTFYSFKGGVGRTLALANIGVALAQNGHRALVVDFDLEAPGLTRYLEKEFGGDLQHKRGLLELLEQQRDTGNAAGHLRRYTVEIMRNTEGGVLELLTSGHQDRSYPKRVLDFDWSEFFMNDGGGDFFEHCRREWAREYDYVLIDSRTGITDSGGVCTIQLPDIIVPVFTASRQSVDGVIDVVRRAQEGRQLLAYDRAPAAIVPLPSRFDSRTEYALSQQWLDEFAIQFEEFYKSWLPKEMPVRQVLERTKLPYVAFFSFGERLPVFEESGSDPESLGYALRTFTRLLESGLQDASSLVAGSGGTTDHGETVTLTGAGTQVASGIGTVAIMAEAAFQGFDPVEQQAARRLLLRMIQIHDGVADTRLRVDRNSLIAQSPDPAVASAVFNAFARARLITADEGAAEITDEALLRTWPRLRSWIDTDRAGHHVHQQLTEAAKRWDHDGRPGSALYRDTALAVAQDWAQEPTHHGDLGKLERDFLAASQALRGRQQQTSSRRAHRLRQRTVGLVVLLILSLAGGVIALYSFALTSPPSPVPQRGPITVLAGHTDTVDAVAFSPDGRTLASASADRTVRLWNMTDLARPESLGLLTGHTGAVFSVAFSPDGRTLATGSNDQTVRLWDVASRQPLGEPLTGHVNSVNTVVFSPTGRILGSSSNDNSVRLWDVTDLRQPAALATLTGHTNAVYGVAFSPDGRILATGSNDQTVRLWNVTDPAHPTLLGQPLTGHTNFVTSVAFSPDGRILATGSHDQTVRLWSLP